VNSTLDLETVLDTIVAKAVHLSGTDTGTIYVFDEAASGEFQLRAAYGMSEELIASLKQPHIGLSEEIAQATDQRTPVQVADLRDESSVSGQVAPAQQIILNAGYRARMIVPLLGANRVVGALVVRRKAPGELGITQYRVQGRAQFVAHIGEELRLVLAGHFELMALDLDFTEQARILNRKHRLRREGLQQIHGRLRESPSGRRL
jgi:GAF domain-containing protein